jgi:hypothetical protein
VYKDGEVGDSGDGEGKKPRYFRRSVCSEWVLDHREAIVLLDRDAWLRLVTHDHTRECWLKAALNRL